MSLRRAYCLSAAALAGLGCSATDPGLEHQRAVNAWLVTSVEDASRERSIITQHTIFPYHFVENSAVLNDLGNADLAVLAGHYRSYPGSLNLRKGDATDDLYDQRKKALLDRLKEKGVDSKEMKISDELPGGDGADSERVVKSLTDEKEKGAKATPSTEPRQNGSASKTAMKGSRR